MIFNGAFWEEQGAVAVGTPVIVLIPAAGDVSVSALPGAGGGLLAETTLSSVAAIKGGTATWFAWPSGTVAANTQDLTIGPVRGLRFTATTADGAYEVLNRPPGTA